MHVFLLSGRSCSSDIRGLAYFVSRLDTRHGFPKCLDTHHFGLRGNYLA